MIVCPKCGKNSGDDWSQCEGACPMKMSPFYTPDKCEVPGCARNGVRGNENIVNGVIMCDDCNAKTLL